MPGFPRIHRQVDARDRARPAHREAADVEGVVRHHFGRAVDAGEEGARGHAIDRDGGKVLRARLHARVGCRRNLVRLRHPVIVVVAGQHLDPVERLDPVGRVPARHDQTDRIAVEHRQGCAVHRQRDHHLAVARVIQPKRLGEPRRAGRRAVEPGDADVRRTGCDAGEVEHVAQAHPAPQRIADRAVAPLRAGHARSKQGARVARTLVHRRDLDTRQLQEVGERQRDRAADSTADAQAKGDRVDRGRDVLIMPADEKAIVGREHRAVHRGERRLQQRRALAQHDHAALLRPVARELTRAAREAEIDRLCHRAGRQPGTAEPQQRERLTAVRHPIRRARRHRAPPAARSARPGARRGGAARPPRRRSRRPRRRTWSPGC